jgi:hypothetical protein
MFKSIFFIVILEETVGRKSLTFFSSVKFPCTQEETIQFVASAVEYLAALINFNVFREWMIYSVIAIVFFMLSPKSRHDTW